MCQYAQSHFALEKELILAGMLPRTVLFTIYACMAFGAFFILIRKEQKTRATWILICAISVGFTYCVCEFAASIMFALASLAVDSLREIPGSTSTDNDEGWYFEPVVVKDYLPSKPFTGNLSVLAALVPSDQELAFIEYFSNDGFASLAGYSSTAGIPFTSPLFIISDMIVVWRAYCFFPGSRWVRMISLITIGIFAFFLMLHIISLAITAASVHAPHNTNIEGVRLYIALMFFYGAIALCILSLAANLFATAGIAYRAYRHKIFTKEAQTRHLAPAAKALVIILESGVVYLVLQVVLMISSYWPPNTYSKISKVFFILAASYPPTLVLLIEYHLAMEPTRKMVIKPTPSATEGAWIDPVMSGVTTDTVTPRPGGFDPNLHAPIGAIPRHDGDTLV